MSPQISLWITGVCGSCPSAPSWAPAAIQQICIFVVPELFSNIVIPYTYYTSPVIIVFFMVLNIHLKFNPINLKLQQCKVLSLKTKTWIMMGNSIRGYLVCEDGGKIDLSFYTKKKLNFGTYNLPMMHRPIRKLLVADGHCGTSITKKISTTQQWLLQNQCLD